MKKYAELTASQIRYLIVIKRLYERQGSVRGADIARELKLSKSSVHRMMDFFEQVQYVKKDCGKHIVLTDDGMGKALEYEKYSVELNKRLFHSKLCDSMQYLYDGEFRDGGIDGRYVYFPVTALNFIAMGKGRDTLLHGSVCLRMQCSVGDMHMPESSAIFTMFIH